MSNLCWFTFNHTETVLGQVIHVSFTKDKGLGSYVWRDEIFIHAPDISVVNMYKRNTDNKLV